MILVDTSVILDIVQDDATWASWSVEAIEAASANDTLAINDVVYAELSVGYPKIEPLDAMLSTWGLELTPIPRSALFLAGKAFRQYRRQAGVKTGVLPDFFIGAHAAAESCALLTRDARRIRTHFPTVRLIAPG